MLQVTTILLNIVFGQDLVHSLLNSLQGAEPPGNHVQFAVFKLKEYSREAIYLQLFDQAKVIIGLFFVGFTSEFLIKDFSIDIVLFNLPHLGYGTLVESE